MKDQGIEFEWDEANREHLSKHDVTPEEAEEAIMGIALDIELQIADEARGEERLLQLGDGDIEDSEI